MARGRTPPGQGHRGGRRGGCSRGHLLSVFPQVVHPHLHPGMPLTQRVHRPRLSLGMWAPGVMASWGNPETSTTLPPLQGSAVPSHLLGERKPSLKTFLESCSAKRSYYSFQLNPKPKPTARRTFVALDGRSPKTKSGIRAPGPGAWLAEVGRVWGQEGMSLCMSLLPPVRGGRRRVERVRSRAGGVCARWHPVGLGSL